MQVPIFGAMLYDSTRLSDGGSDHDDSDDIKYYHEGSRIYEGDNKVKEVYQLRKRRHSSGDEKETSDWSSDTSDVALKSRKRRRCAEPAVEVVDSGSKPQGKRRTRASSAENAGCSSKGTTSLGRKSKKARRKYGSKSSSSSDMESHVIRDDGSNKQNASMNDFTTHVYHAIREEHFSFGLSMTPCTHCPTFTFCKVGGPVNPSGCGYFKDWMNAGEVPVDF